MTAGAAVAALGAALCVAMVLRPQALRVPAPVGYLCGLAFVLAGCTLAARARQHARLAAWLPVPLLACMAAPPLWLALGSGRCPCTVAAMQSVLRIVGARPDFVCRAGFALAAALGLLLVALAVWHALRASRAP